MDNVTKDLPAILAISLSLGGVVLYLIIHSVASNWRAVRVVEQHAILKQSMVEKGFTAGEIEAVMKAGADPKDKIDATA